MNSPSLTWRRATMPEKGAVTLALRNARSARPSPARAAATCERASRSSASASSSRASDAVRLEWSFRMRCASFSCCSKRACVCSSRACASSSSSCRRSRSISKTMSPKSTAAPSSTSIEVTRPSTSAATLASFTASSSPVTRMRSTIRYASIGATATGGREITCSPDPWPQAATARAADRNASTRGSARPVIASSRRCARRAVAGRSLGLPVQPPTGVRRV